MTTTRRSSQSRARFVLTALASFAVLAASALVTSATAASPVRLSSHQRPDRADHRVVHHDARRDVLLFNVKSETSRPVPGDRATDITRTVVDHRANRTALHVRARQLSRSGYRLLVAEILTSDGRRYELVVDYSTQPIGSRVSLERSGTGAEVTCPGASWSIDRSAARIGASLPNSCVHHPAWVRVGLGLVAAPHGLKTSRADDSRARAHVGDRHLTLGPRQHRA
jgi:hypothetical protein